MKYIFLMFFSLAFAGLKAQDLKKVKELEQVTARTIAAAYPSSVQIMPYDTVTKKPGNGVFSGVVVSKEGHILTAAHAAKPDAVYRVSFPDGKHYLAKGLGRIAVKEGQRGLDLAMIGIIDKGVFPFAEMAWSSDMKVGNPAISIAYPGAFDGKSPTVRFGRLTDVDISSGYFVSTCKMEPGDSGGPVYDANGRVLGIHSWIKTNEEMNYEVPVDLYRKYWTALNVAKDYKDLPVADEMPEHTQATKLPFVPEIQSLLKVPTKLAKNTLQISSMVDGKVSPVLGTVIGTYVLSKSSMIGDDPVTVISRQKLKILTRDKENDLVLLKASGVLNPGIKLSPGRDSSMVLFSELGKFLVSALAENKQYLSVLSSQYRAMPLRSSSGYFGANARFIDEKITITDIAKGSSAADVLKLNDQVTGINGMPISRPPQYGAELAKYFAGDSITIDAIREGKAIQLLVHLKPYKGRNHVADQFKGGRSLRSDGFKKVLVHDAAILPEECGGAVYDAEGRFYGINIARHSRTSTVIMPADVIFDFIKKNIKDEKK